MVHWYRIRYSLIYFLLLDFWKFFKKKSLNKQFDDLEIPKRITEYHSFTWKDTCQQNDINNTGDCLVDDFLTEDVWLFANSASLYFHQFLPIFSNGNTIWCWNCLPIFCLYFLSLYMVRSIWIYWILSILFLSFWRYRN